MLLSHLFWELYVRSRAETHENVVMVTFYNYFILSSLSFSKLNGDGLKVVTVWIWCFVFCDCK